MLGGWTSLKAASCLGTSDKSKGDLGTWMGLVNRDGQEKWPTRTQLQPWVQIAVSRGPVSPCKPKMSACTELRTRDAVLPEVG